MTMEMILGFIRHALTFGGGWLVANDVIGASDVEAGVAAAATLIGLGWSAWRKWERRT